ncbi:conserved hypothetical protein [Leishmania braziliensis MHOM/BR/75/M2904]|uniref:Uncharacterized protein n=2 Tax=Leishmania braziliensis TaxID=5660 RepID=A4H916_LEIBR|nr:conserved hypothetical protein [Leishmania braziliensis MHOM/BR/75/M2904]CAJ2470056.1 unnamed protein product [Leishmania braziliensis]CAM37885.1 conserved hypothetical protein [Leishmania braziliensis MHOM/BR/75/M2904]SYZ64553.1 hypothetical_protein [Leishmania braziliensis MHOM/BR/75/M2904]
MHQEHIQRLASHDAAVLRASHEFPTFTDAFACVAQVGLPVLEAEASRILFSYYGKEASHNMEVSLCLPALAWDITRTCILPITDEVRRRAEVAVEGNGTLPSAAAGTGKRSHAALQPDGLELFGRLAAICADVSVSVRMEVVESAAVEGKVCPAEVFASGREAGGGAAARPSYESHSCLLVLDLVPETRWHCGQQMPLVEKHARRRRHASRYPSCHDSSSGSSSRDSFSDISDGARERCNSVHLITVCRVRGLFYNLPVRQIPYVALIGTCSFSILTGSSSGCGGPCKTLSDRDREELLHRRSSGACKSASAMRARREEQQHLLAVVFQTAVCTLLAPLYLTGTPLDASADKGASIARHSLPAQSVSGFSAKMIAEYDFCGDASIARGMPAETLPLHPLSLSTPLRCVSAPRVGSDRGDIHPDSAWAAAGLRVDRHGLYSGALWVHQASREVDIGGKAGHRRTRGEATARRLCRAFGAPLPDPSSAPSSSATRAQRRAGRSRSFSSTAASWKGSGKTPEETLAEGVLTEVVVRPGHFVVLFLTPPPLGATAVPARETPYTVESHPFAPFPERHGTLFMILVRDCQAHPLEDDDCRGRSAPLSSALCPTHCRVLEPTHWAYDIVATNTRRRRHSAHPLSGRSITAAAAVTAAVPAFVFVDSTYVPARISEARQRTRNGDSVQQTFAQLYDEALQRLTSGWRGCESDEAPLEDYEKALPAQTATSHETIPDQQQQPISLVPNNVLVKQEAAEVQLRVRYLCQQVLEAAAVPGMQSYTSAPPSTKHSSLTASSESVAGRTGTLHRVQLNPASLLWLSATARSVNSSAAAPRRTPVTLDPNLHRITREEKEEQAALHTRPPLEASLSSREPPGPVHHPSPVQVSNTEEKLTRMRHLLDTGRGNALRRLPRACAAPCPWIPEKGADRGVESGGSNTSKGATAVLSEDVMPPITTAFSARVSVLQWARKFLVIASPNTPRCAFKPTCSPAAVAPQGSVCRHQPHVLEWWVADQHAVHERVRLEFFLCFADTYVCHPELQDGMECTGSESVILGSGAVSEHVARTSLSLSPHARRALERRHRVAQLLRSLAVTDPACSPSASMAAVSFAVSLPAEWRLRVTAVEAHLRQWGWRFHHESEAVAHRGERQCNRDVAWASDARVDQSTYSRTRPSLATAVVAWPCLKVEGVVRHVTSTQALQETVVELEVVGAAAKAEFDCPFMPSQPAATDPVSSCARSPGSLHVPRCSSPCPLLIPSVFLNFFISRSCRGAIMFGDVLRPNAARSMVAALDCVEQYYVCSHGRPSFTHLTPAQ